MKNLPTLRNDSSFPIQLSNSVSKTRAILLFTRKIIQMFELHARMPPMRSAEQQATIPLKFLIIKHNYANVKTINQSKSLPGFRVVVGNLRQRRFRGDGDRNGRASLEQRLPSLPSKIRNIKIAVNSGGRRLGRLQNRKIWLRIKN